MLYIYPKRKKASLPRSKSTWLKFNSKVLAGISCKLTNSELQFRLSPTISNYNFVLTSEKKKKKLQINMNRFMASISPNNWGKRERHRNCCQSQPLNFNPGKPLISWHRHKDQHKHLIVCSHNSNPSAMKLGISQFMKKLHTGAVQQPRFYLPHSVCCK